MALGRAPDGLAPTSESAELGHRRMGHINHKSLDVLRKKPSSGVDYTGDLNNCSTCPFEKSAQQPHPKQATYNVLRPFPLVSVDTLGPFTPKSLGGFKYAVTFVDQQTMRKEAMLMKDKTCSVDALVVIVKENRDSYRRAHPYPARGPQHGTHERGVTSVLSRRRHQAGVCLSEHPSADRSKRACGPDDFRRRALFSRRLDTSTAFGER